MKSTGQFVTGLASEVKTGVKNDEDMDIFIPTTKRDYTYLDFFHAANYIRQHTAIMPKIAIILGSGLSSWIENHVANENEDDDKREGKNESKSKNKSKQEENKKTDTILFKDIAKHINGFPTTSVKGHDNGCFIFLNYRYHHQKKEQQEDKEKEREKVNDVDHSTFIPLLIMKGRFHFYEGHSMQAIAFPIFIMKELGIQTVIVTNAAGGIAPSPLTFQLSDVLSDEKKRRKQNFKLQAGDIMLIKDHITLNQNVNPLIAGHGYTKFGTNSTTKNQGSTSTHSAQDNQNVEADNRNHLFIPATNLYDRKLRYICQKICKEEEIDLKEGVYIYSTGPSYETPAEIQLYSYFTGIWNIQKHHYQKQKLKQKQKNKERLTPHQRLCANTNNSNHIYIHNNIINRTSKIWNFYFLKWIFSISQMAGSRVILALEQIYIYWQEKRKEKKKFVIDPTIYSAIGMSTVPEVVACNYCKIKVIGLSGISNMTILNHIDIQDESEYEEESDNDNNNYESTTMVRDIEHDPDELFNDLDDSSFSLLSQSHENSNSIYTNNEKEEDEGGEENNIYFIDSMKNTLMKNYNNLHSGRNDEDSNNNKKNNNNNNNHNNINKKTEEHDQVLNVMEDIVTPKLTTILNRLLFELYMHTNRQRYTPQSTFYKSNITDSTKSLFDEKFEVDLSALSKENQSLTSLQLCVSWTQFFSTLGIVSVNIIHSWIALKRNLN